MKTLELLGGEHIDNACKEACALAIQSGEDVGFSFNGQDVVATPKSSWQEVAKDWSDKMDASSKAYRESSEGLLSAAKREQDIAEKQKRIDLQILSLDQVCYTGSLDDVLNWLEPFTKDADDVGVKVNYNSIVSVFLSAEYENNWGVGKPPEFFNTKENMGNYIIGQAISCMKSGMPPHHICLTFIEKYRGLKS